MAGAETIDDHGGARRRRRCTLRSRTTASSTSWARASCSARRDLRSGSSSPVGGVAFVRERPAHRRLVRRLLRAALRRGGVRAPRAREGRSLEHRRRQRRRAGPDRLPTTCAWAAAAPPRCRRSSAPGSLPRLKAAIGWPASGTPSSPPARPPAAQPSPADESLDCW